MKLIKKPSSKIFLESHIYDQSFLSNERLSEFFNAVEDYSQATRMKKLAAFQKLNDIFNVYEDGFKKHVKNKYFNNYIFKIISSIFDFAESDFQTSDLQTPSTLDLIQSKRKYPIHMIEKTFRLKSILKNQGPGVAFDSRINLLDYDEGLKIFPEELNLGDIDIGEYEVQFNVDVLQEQQNTPSIMGVISWCDYKGEKTEKDFIIEVTPQNSDIEWDKIKYQQPYSLESVENEDELIGRKGLLETISEKLKLKKMESTIIYGQKRVGKTSLARTIQGRFKHVDNYVGIFIETGSLDKSSSEKFIKSLGKKIIKNIGSKVDITNFEIDNFDGSLYPLVTFIEDVMLANENLKIVIIIDEFDEIPIQLYPYTESGDSFFHSLRSLSGESGVGRVSLILVGGENMGVIMQTTDKLNKFDAYNVGYFDKSNHWDQFIELVESPVKGIMEYSHEAITALYDVTEGNPFYTKFIAKNLYKKMASDHCSYISQDEMNEAIQNTMNNMEAINLIHFWNDCIRVENQESRDLIETHRRRFLIGFAENMRAHHCVDKKRLLSDPSISGIPSIEILDSFLSRNIIIEEKGKLVIKPKIFETWLIEKGIHNLISSFSDADALQVFKEKDKETYIKDVEIIELVKTWESYKGTQITNVDVREWLNQFNSNHEKRIAFNLLQNIKFYGELLIREKLRTIHEIIKKTIVYTYAKDERVRKDILVSCFGTASKSGPTYLRMYASENKITTHSIKQYSEIKKTIETDANIQALVFIDDILATGESIFDALVELDSECGQLLIERDILVVVGVICGLSDGIEMLNAKATQFKFRLEIEVCDIITDDDKVLSETTQIFSSQEGLVAAKELCRKYGTRIHKQHPLGFKNSQLLVVFKDNCPNNTLPIIWETSNNPKWVPLFKRG